MNQLQTELQNENTKFKTENLLPWQRRLYFLVWMWIACVVALIVWFIFISPSVFVSPEYIQSAFWPTVIFSLIVFIGFIKFLPVIGSGSDRNAEKIRQWSDFRKYFFMPLVTAGVFGYFPISVALPSLLSQVVGKPCSGTLTITRIVPGGRRGRCNQIYVQELDDYWYGTLCVSNSAIGRMKIGDRTNFYGSRSWFGLQVKAL